MAQLREPLNFRELLNGGTTFTVSFNSDEAATEIDNYEDALRGISNLDCLGGLGDEDNYEEGEPFEQIAQKMNNLTPDGKLKKRIIREGSGEAPGEFAVVKIEYNAFLEFDEHPFDSTYATKRPKRFTLGRGEVITGLDLGVQSMRTGEKSQFMVHPDYGFGANILTGKIPPNATILFEVELVEVVNSGAALTFEKLPEEQQKNFEAAYKYGLAQCEKAKSLCRRHNYHKAVIEYNQAISKLEAAELTTKEQGVRQYELLLRLYSNLLICHTKNGNPRKGLTAAEKIDKITDNGEYMDISAKVHFNHGKCLRLLGEYAKAKEVLNKARKLEPKNPDITNEFFLLENDREEHKKKQMVFAKALVE